MLHFDVHCISLCNFKTGKQGLPQKAKSIVMMMTAIMISVEVEMTQAKITPAFMTFYMEKVSYPEITLRMPKSDMRIAGKDPSPALAGWGSCGRWSLLHLCCQLSQ